MNCKQKRKGFLMQAGSIRIIDGTPPVLSCQSEVAQIKIMANHPFSGQEIQAIFQTIANRQIALQRITIHVDQIGFSVPRAMTGSIVPLFRHSQYRITANGNCAAILLPADRAIHRQSRQKLPKR